MTFIWYKIATITELEDLKPLLPEVMQGIPPELLY